MRYCAIPHENNVRFLNFVNGMTQGSFHPSLGWVETKTSRFPHSINGRSQWDWLNRTITSNLIPTVLHNFILKKMIACLAQDQVAFRISFTLDIGFKPVMRWRVAHYMSSEAWPILPRWVDLPIPRHLNWSARKIDRLTWNSTLPGSLNKFSSGIV